jgi:hypothetical protein
MQPQKDFFIGSQTQQRACHSLDISAFVTFEQLKGALAKRFGFADSRGMIVPSPCRSHSSDGKQRYV